MAAAKARKMVVILAGVSIGIIIGFIAGIIAAILIRAALSGKYSPREIIVELAEIVTLIGGGQWAGSTIFAALPPEAWVQAYFPSVAIALLLTVVYPAAKFIFYVGRTIGRESPP